MIMDRTPRLPALAVVRPFGRRMVILPLQSVISFALTLALIAVIFSFMKDRIIPAVAADSPAVARSLEQEQEVIKANVAGRASTLQVSVDTASGGTGAGPSFRSWTPYHLDVRPMAPGVFEFQYPALDDPFLLVHPIGRPYVMLSFDTPVPLTSIQLEGEGLNQAHLYVSFIDPSTGHDDATVIEIGTVQAGRKLRWNLRSLGITYKITAIQLTAQLTGNDRRVVITMKPDAG